MRYYLSLFLFVIALLAWSPWLSQEEALKIVDAKVAELQQTVPNLCDMFIYPDSIHKVPFGYAEEVSHDCTINDPAYGVSQATDIVYITFYKGIIGMPRQTFVNN